MDTKLKIGVFAYNFPHWKTQTGLFNLCFNGYKPDVVLAADGVKLNFPQSKIRTTTSGLYLQQTKDLCKFYDIPFYNVAHNSEEAVDIVKNYELDLGIILGARILKQNIINPFKIGIINMHPGVLPANRGLDNVKWSVVKRLPVGVTVHFIDSKIDMGHKIIGGEIEIKQDDEFLDFCTRNQNLEQKLLIDALDKIYREYPNIKTTELTSGVYHKALPPELETNLYDEVIRYKQLWQFSQTI